MIAKPDSPLHPTSIKPFAALRHLIASVLLLMAPAVSADEVAIYRCTDANGVLTVQNMPCPDGMQAQKQMVRGLSTRPEATPGTTLPVPAPMPAPMSEAATPSESATQSLSDPKPTPQQPDEYRILDSNSLQSAESESTEDTSPRLPPPVMFECTTYDMDHYISEDPQPPPRCVPIQNAGGSAGEICEMKRDQCARVPDGALCAAWKKRLGETEVAWRFGRPENKERNKSEYDRVKRIMDESACDP